MKKKFFIRLLLIIIFGTSLHSCRTDEETINNQTSKNDVQNAKNIFEKENPKFKILQFVDKIDWEHAILSSGKDFDAVEVPLIIDDKYSISSSEAIEKPYHRLLFRKSKNSNLWEMWYLYISVDPNVTVDEITYTHLDKDYKGKVVIFDRNNNLVDRLSFNDPKSSHSTTDKEIVFTRTYFGSWSGSVFTPMIMLGCTSSDGDGPGYGNPNPSQPPHGGGGSGGTGSGGMTMAPPPDVAIPDIKKFLSCLNTSQSANLRIYAEKYSTDKPGHAFISITQGNNTMTFGFYPKNGATQVIYGPGVFGDDSGHAYTNIWNVGTITPSQLQSIITTADSFSQTNYNLAMNNCADFALSVINNVGYNINTSGIDQPTIVHDIIKSHTGNSIGGNAPQTKRTCN